MSRRAARGGRTYSASALANSSSSLSLATVSSQIEKQSYSHHASPYGVLPRPVELRSWVDDDYVGDLPHEYWPGKLKYCDVYIRKWVGYSDMHKYWKNPFGWERGLPRYNVTYTPFGWRSFKRYRYAINPPLIRVP